MADFFFFSGRHQVRHRNSGGERCKRSERRSAAANFIGFSGWHRRVAFRQIAPVNAAGRISFL
jgi:hypothetical protein